MYIMNLFIIIIMIIPVAIIYITHHTEFSLLIILYTFSL